MTEYYSLFFSILLFSVSTTVTPGPNNIMVMTSSINFGIRRTLPHFLGICFGFPTMVFAVALGLGSVFSHFPLLHQIIKIIGAIYLLYLAWKIATSHSKIKNDKVPKPLSFLQAALFQWVNPKAWVMAIGAVAAYTTPQGNIYQQIIIISATFFLVSFPCVGVWMFFGSGLKYFLKNDRHQRLFNYTMGFLLALSVLLIFFE